MRKVRQEKRAREEELEGGEEEIQLQAEKSRDAKKVTSCLISKIVKCSQRRGHEGTESSRT